MSAFIKEMKRREKAKELERIKQLEEEGEDHIGEAYETKKQNVFDLLRDEDSNVVDNNDDNDDDDDYIPKKVPVENLKPKKSKKKKGKQPITLPDELDENDEEEFAAPKKQDKKKQPQKKQQKEQIPPASDNKKKLEKKKKRQEKQKEDQDFLEQELKKQEEKKLQEMETLRTEGDSAMNNVDWDFAKIDFNYLNPDYEFKKLFGSKALSASQQYSDQNEHLPKHIRNNKHHKLKSNTTLLNNHQLQIVTPKPHWPHYMPLGLTCTLQKIVGQLELFVIDDSANDIYKNLQKVYNDAVASHDPNSFVQILQSVHPYHVHTLLQLSEVYRTLHGEADQAQDLIERALFALQHAVNTSAFIRTLKEGRARIAYTSDLNCMFYHVLLARLHALGRSGGHATAFELSKLVFSLSNIEHSYGDPAHVLLFIDFYAIRAGRYGWLTKHLIPHLERVANPDANQASYAYLPNLMFGRALAYYLMNDFENANTYLQDALLMWPMALPGIVNECARSQIAVWNQLTQNSIFTDIICTSQSISNLIHICVKRHEAIWKQDPQLIPWLKTNVQRVLERIVVSEGLEAEYLKKRKLVYSDASIAQSYETVFEQEIMGNMLPLRSQQNDDEEASSDPVTQRTPLMAFLHSLLPWNDNGDGTGAPQ